MQFLFNNEWFKSITALVIGWSLNALSPYFAERRERRKAFSRVLTDLLDIRNELFLADYALDEIGKAVTLTPEIEIQLRVGMQNLLPNQQQLQQRYNESVSQVAALDPLLGYQLRSKDILRPLISALFSSVAQTQDMQAAAFLKKMNALVLKEADKSFEEIILTVARKRSLWTRYKTKKKLAAGGILSGADALTQLLRDEAAKHMPPADPQPQKEDKSAAAKA
jgi:hypothetical protein